MMKNENLTPSIFHFTNYRDYLKAYFEYQKQNNPKFSNRNFCLKARVPLKNSSIISKIIKGNRKLSQNLRLKFSLALNLNEEEQHYLDIMSQYTHLTDEREKEILYQKMLGLQNPNRKTNPKEEANISNLWIAEALKNFFRQPNNQGTFLTLTSQHFPQLTREEIEKGLKNLFEDEQNGSSPLFTHNQRVTQTPPTPHDKSVFSQPGSYSPNAPHRFRESENGENHSFNQKEPHSLTMHLSQDGVNTVKEKLTTFKEEVRSLLKENQAGTKPYVLNMHFRDQAFNESAP